MPMPAAVLFIVSPPHPRGSSPRRRGDARQTSVSPAPAGIIPGRMGAAGGGWRLPRTRGDHPMAGAASPSRCAPPPHPRETSLSRTPASAVGRQADEQPARHDRAHRGHQPQRFQHSGRTFYPRPRAQAEDQHHANRRHHRRSPRPSTRAIPRPAADPGGAAPVTPQPPRLAQRFPSTPARVYVPPASRRGGGAARSAVPTSAPDRPPWRVRRLISAHR